MLAISRRLFPVLNTRAFSLTPNNNSHGTASRAQQSTLSEGERTIYEKLTDKFDPSQLEVKDISGGCGTFYAIEITSEKFQGLPLVMQHRLVKNTLEAEIKAIHGVQIKTIAQ